MFILTYFLRGLQGKKQKIKLVLGEARDYITEAENHCKHKHVIFSLRGRLKGETSESFLGFNNWIMDEEVVKF